MAERVRVHDLDVDEGSRLLRIVRSDSGSVVTWRWAQMVLLSAQGMDVPALQVEQGLRGVASGGAAAGVGEGAVLAAALVSDAVDLESLPPAEISTVLPMIATWTWRRMWALPTR